jgi:PAS domain S-box-containing protein
MKSYRNMSSQELAEVLQQSEDVPEHVRQVMLKILWDLKQYEEELRIQNEELRRAALKLEAMAERYTSLFHAAPLGLAVVDTHGLVRRVNAALVQLLGAARYEVEGHPITIFFHRHSHTLWMSLLDQAARGYSGRERLLLAQDEHPVLASLGPVAADELLLTLVDQGAEEAAREDQRRALASFRTLVERTPLGLCITNPQGIFEYVNPAYCRLYGYSSDELVGQHFTLVVPEEQRAEITVLHDRFFAGDAELRGEWEVLRNDGQRLHILADAARIEGEDGAPRKLTFVMDITERVAAERLRQDIEAIVRHDLRAPLSGIVGLTPLLLESPNLEVEERQMMEAIHKAGRRMLRMLGESVSLVAMERGTYELTAQSVDLTAVLAEVRADLEEIRRRKRIEIHVSQCCATDQCLVFGEEALLYSIFANLLRNALEASPTGATVEVDIRCGPQILLTFKNPGSIPEEFLPRLFEKFATWGKQGGTGLGTYSARLMARTMGGDVVATSADGEVRFTVILPAVL